MDLMQKARAQLMLKQPFFASLLMNLDSVERPDIPTMATDMRKIYYNPEWVEQELQTVPKVMFVMAHEVMHVCLEHGLRTQGRNHMLWNIACDFAINLILVDSGLEYPGNGCLDPKYKGLSADQIYQLLQEQAEQERKRGGSGKPGEGNMPGLDDLHGEGGDLMEPEAMSAGEKAELQRQIQQKVAQAANIARMAGSMGGELARLVDSILDPQVPWFDLLRDKMMRITKDSESWTRRNRRFSNVYLPARYSERMGPIVVIGDTSGSITNDELAKAGTEIQAIADQLKPEHIRVLWADTKVAGEQVFEDGDLILVKPAGGGGTDMRVPLAHAEQYEPEVVVLITDGYTPWPDAEPPYPLITCCTTDVDVPVGDVVRMR